MFINSCFIELLVYFLLILVSLGTSFLLQKGNEFAHFINDLRVVYILAFGFYMLKHAIDAWVYDWYLVHRPFFWQTFSYIVGIIYVILFAIEILMIGIQANFTLAKPAYKKYHN